METVRQTNGSPAAIVSLDIDGVKRIRAVHVEPRQTGLTVIAGRNGQGKTSVLESIMAALGGDSYRQQVNDGTDKGEIRIKLSNGLEVARTIKADGASTLKVKCLDGSRGSQTLLNKFISGFALNVPSFMSASAREKVKALLDVIGFDPQPYEERIKTLEAERLAKGREADRVKGHAAELPFHDGVGVTLASDEEMRQDIARVAEHNARFDRALREVEFAAQERARLAEEAEECRRRIAGARKALDEVEDRQSAAEEREEYCKQQWRRMGDRLSDTEAAERMKAVADRNEKVRANQAKHRAQDDAEALAEEYRELDRKVKGERAALAANLEGVRLPYPGLSVSGNVLQWKGRPFDELSESEKLIIATSISKAVNPDCSFVLVDGLERFDTERLAKFAAWCEKQGMQVIGTRVGTGADNEIIIEDGEVKG